MTATAKSVELIQSMFDAFGRGDIEFITSRLTPDCRWMVPGEGIPAAGAYTGPEGAAAFFRKMAESEEMTRFEPKEYFTNGNDVVVLGLEECRARATGRTASTNWAMLFRVRDGKVSHFETHFDTAAYVRAHAGAHLTASGG